MAGAEGVTGELREGSGAVSSRKETEKSEIMPDRVANATTIIDLGRMAVPRSFADLVAATARQKHAAAKARQNPDATAEKPREAIFDALHLVGDAIVEDGYTFSPSTPKFVRKHGDFTFEIRVQSDRNNLAGQRAAVWVHAAIYSRSLTVWRKKHYSGWIRPDAPFPLPLLATQLGYLSDPAGWVEWDFANKAKRRSTADDLTASIRAGAYPLFSVFEGAIEGIATIADREWLQPEGTLRYLLASGHTDLADKTLRHYLDKRPDFRAQFKRLHHQFVEHGLPSCRTATAHDLAAFAVATGYPWSASDSIQG